MAQEKSPQKIEADAVLAAVEQAMTAGVPTADLARALTLLRVTGYEHGPKERSQGRAPEERGERVVTTVSVWR